MELILHTDLLCRACISPNDSLPKSICSRCHRLLHDFQDFQRMCVESHKMLFDRIGIGAPILENGEELAFKNESSSEVPESLSNIERMDEFSDIKLENNAPDNRRDQTNPDVDESSALILENNDSGQWMDQKDEKPFDSPKKHIDPLPDDDLKYEVLAEQLEEIVAEIKNSKSLEEGNSIRCTDSERLKEKTDVLEDGTQTIVKKNESSEESQTKIFFCEKCSKMFHSKVHYEGHLRWHVGKKPYACQQCSAEYSRLYLLKRHVLQNHTGNEVRFHCTVEGCEKNYLNRQSLGLHMSTHSSSELMNEKKKQTMICESGGKTLSEETSREQEEICSMDYMDEISDLKEENSDWGQWRDKKDEESLDGPKKYIDPLPDDDLKYEVLAEQLGEIVAEIKNSESLEEENSIRGIHSERLREKTDVLDDGTQVIVKENESSLSTRNTFVCRKCSKMFYTKAHYEGHLRWHEGKKPYACQQCSTEYSRLYELKRHVLKNHTGNEVRFYCAVEGCEKNYLNRQTLAHHMITHSSSQPMRENEKLTVVYESPNETLSKETGFLSHACEQCPKKFHFPNQLEEHKLVHLSIKKHANIHTRKKEYVCQFCKTHLLHRKSLLRHIRVVHDGIKAYRCKFCNHSFAESQTLKYHIMRHTGETPYKCPYCDRRFIQKSTMKNHARRHLSHVGKVDILVESS